MDQTAFLALVAEILETEADAVSMDSSLEALDWDSLSNISFIAEADTTTGATIDADDLAKAVTVADLYALLPAPAGA